MQLNLVLVLALAGAVPPTGFSEDRLAPIFSDFEYCFVLKDTTTGKRHSLGPACSERSTPASTFKVPHALLALETGVVPHPAFELPWDGKQRSIRAWNRDHDLSSAVQNSVLWYFQETARRIGEERMSAGVTGLKYGNADTSGGLTTFWLGGALGISPHEQVEFLDRLRLRELPVSQHSQTLVRDLLVVERRPDGVLRGKSGTHLGPDVGWFVGWVEREGRSHVFATRLRGKGARGFSRARAMSLRALAQLEIWPD